MRVNLGCARAVQGPGSRASSAPGHRQRASGSGKLGKTPPPPGAQPRGPKNRKDDAGRLRHDDPVNLWSPAPGRSVPCLPRPVRCGGRTSLPFGRWFLGSALYSLTLGYGTPRSFFAVAPDSWPGDPVLGQRLLAGEFAGPRQRRRRAARVGRSAVAARRRRAALARCPERLRLAARPARLRRSAAARCWPPAWSTTGPTANGAGRRCTWRRDVLAARIVAWIRHYDWLAAAADPGFAARFVFSLGRQRVHLRRAARTGMVGHEAVAVLQGADLRRPRLPARRQALREEPRADAGAARQVREALCPARRRRGRARAAPAARRAAPSARRARGARRRPSAARRPS